MVIEPSARIGLFILAADKIAMSVQIMSLVGRLSGKVHFVHAF